MKIICFDFDDVIADGNLINKAMEMSGDRGIAFAARIILNRKSFDPKYFYKTIKKFIKFAKGVEFDKLKEIVLGFKPTKNVAGTFKKLKDSGHKILIISINDEKIIRAYLKKYRLESYIDRIYGSELGVKNKKLSGKITGDVLRGEKTTVLKQIEKIYNVKRKDIVYVADGLTDMPMMKIVGRGILFCPTPVTKIEIFADKNLMKRIERNSLFIVEKKDMKEILLFT